MKKGLFTGILCLIVAAVVVVIGAFFIKSLGKDKTEATDKPETEIAGEVETESTDTPDEQARQREAWITVQRGHAIANGLPVISVNRVGLEPDPSGATNGITFWGSSFVAGPQGEFLYQAPTDSEVEKIVDVDMTRSEHVRRWWPFLRDRRIDAYKGITSRFLD